MDDCSFLTLLYQSQSDARPSDLEAVIAKCHLAVSNLQSAIEANDRYLADQIDPQDLFFSALHIDRAYREHQLVCINALRERIKKETGR